LALTAIAGLGYIRSMKAADRKKAYELVSGLASLDEAQGLKKERAVLLLWFLRSVVGLDDVDAYDYICDGDNDGGVDALYLEEAQADGDLETLVVYQSYFTERPGDIGQQKLGRLISIASNFKTAGALAKLLDGKTEPQFRRLVSDFSLVQKLTAGDYEDGKLRLRLVLVTTGILDTKAAELVDSTNSAEGKGYLTVYDLPRLTALAEVVAAPDAGVAELKIQCPRSERLIVKTENDANRVAILPIRAVDIAKWEGLESRKLFALNVRGEIKKNRVRDQLDAAIRRPSDHSEFLAAHNGMTVTCDRFDDTNAKVFKVIRPSVVNGAQSAIAFWRGDQNGSVTDDLRVFVKFVEVHGHPNFAASVSARSNTQTAVNPRNLVAHTGPQRRLQAEFKERFPAIVYELKHDATLALDYGGQVIPNDDAAQLLCAVYNEEPWLAVKRNTLFEADNYPRIFNSDIHAEHVVLVDVLRKQVQDERALVPERYRKSWRLTRLVVVYLLAQILRASDKHRDILENPEKALKNRKKLAERLELPTKAAILTLSKRRDQRLRDDEEDDYTVDFKNTDQLLAMRDAARDAYLTLEMAATITKD
jgi:hypothetical protein